MSNTFFESYSRTIPGHSRTILMIFQDKFGNFTGDFLTRKLRVKNSRKTFFRDQVLFIFFWDQGSNWSWMHPIYCDQPFIRQPVPNHQTTVLLIYLSPLLCQLEDDMHTRAKGLTHSIMVDSETESNHASQLLKGLS